MGVGAGLFFADAESVLPLRPCLSEESFELRLENHDARRPSFFGGVFACFDSSCGLVLGKVGVVGVVGPDRATLGLRSCVN